MKKSEKFWDFLSNNYDAGEADSPERKDFEITKTYLHPEDNVLDYACGTGTLSIEISSLVREVVAVDISSKMLARAKNKAADRKIQNITFYHTTIGDESLQEGSFDAILAFNILHLLEDSDLVLEKINRLLKPGGIFISTTACAGEEMKGGFRTVFSLVRLASKLGIMPSVQVLKITELESEIVKANFQILETENFYDEAVSHFVVAKKC